MFHLSMSEVAKPPRRVPGPAKGLAAVSLLNDIASEMVYPLLPAFMTRVLGAGPLALGLLDGAADFSAAILRWVSGQVADRPRWRGRLIVGGYGLATLVRPMIATTVAAWQVVGLRMADRVGKGLRSPARDALLADLTPHAAHGRAFGLHRAADHLGAVLGAVAAWALVSRGVSVRGVITASILPGVSSFLVVVAVLAWTRRHGHPPERATRSGSGSGRPRSRGAPGSGTLVALALLSAARVPETLLLLRLQDVGVAVASLPLVWAALHLVRSASSYPAGATVDRFGAAPVLVLGSLIYGAGLVLLARGGGPWYATAVLVGLGLAEGLAEPAARVVVARVGVGRRGRAFGTYQALFGLGALAAGLVLGGLYQTHGAEVALRAGAALVTVALPVWIVVARRSATS